MPKPKYNLKDSPFYRLRTKAKLAKLLLTSQERLRYIVKLENGYTAFQKPKKDGTMRDISAPIIPLKRVQSRIADLLRRIAPPDYLFAPVEGRSYVDNAAQHIGSRSYHLLDIENFFPSCSFKKVLWFFRSKMECSPDVAYILAKIATEKDVLPQGSPCSPILAYFSYIDMWTEIAICVAADSCKLSVYADDLTISGETIHEATIWKIKEIMRKHGHRHAIHKERSRRDRPAEVTGVILGPNGVFPPNRQRLKISVLRDTIKATKLPRDKEKLHAQLRGRIAQINQINMGNKPQKG